MSPGPPTSSDDGEFEKITADVRGLTRKRASGLHKYRCGGYTGRNGTQPASTRGVFSDLYIIGRRESGLDNDFDDNIVHVYYGPFEEYIPTPPFDFAGREGCCPNECPCYPMDQMHQRPLIIQGQSGKDYIANRRFVDPPMHLKRQVSGNDDHPAHKYPRIVERMKPTVEGLNYNHGAMNSSDPDGQRALNMFGVGHFQCPDADDECKNKDHGDCGSVGEGPTDPNGQHKQCNPKPCCRNPVCDDTMYSHGGAGLKIHEAIPDNFNTSLTTGNLAGITTHNRCWQPWKHLRVWFWIMPYWDAPTGNYSGPDNDDYDGRVTYEGNQNMGSAPGCSKGGMYVTSDGGRAWTEGILTNGYLKISQGVEGMVDTELGEVAGGQVVQPGQPVMQQGIEWQGNWGWFYHNSHAGQTPFGDKIVFGYGGGTTLGAPDPDTIPCIGPRQWQFHHADMFYMQVDADGNPVYPGSGAHPPGTFGIIGAGGLNPQHPIRRTMAKITLHVGYYKDDGTPELLKIMDGREVDMGHVETHPSNKGLGSGELTLGGNRIHGAAGNLGYGAYHLVNNGWIPTRSPTDLGSTYPGVHNPTTPGNQYGEPFQPMYYGGWLIDGLGFDKGSSRIPDAVGGDTKPEFTAEELWNNGKGVPCIGGPDIREPQFPEGSADSPLNFDAPDAIGGGGPPDLDDDDEGFEDLDDLLKDGWNAEKICIKDNEDFPLPLEFEFNFAGSTSGFSVPTSIKNAANSWAERIARPGLKLTKDGEEPKYRMKPKVNCNVTGFHNRSPFLATCSVGAVDTQFRLPSSINVRVNMFYWNAVSALVKYKILLHELGHGVGITSAIWGLGTKLINRPITATAYSLMTNLNRPAAPVTFRGPLWATGGFANHGHWLPQCACYNGQIYYGLYGGKRFGAPDGRSELMTPIISRNQMIITHLDCAFLVDIGWCCNTRNDDKTWNPGRVAKAQQCCSLTSGGTGTPCQPAIWDNRFGCVDCGGNLPQPTETEMYEMNKEIEKGIIGYCGGSSNDVVYHEYHEEG